MSRGGTRNKATGPVVPYLEYWQIRRGRTRIYQLETKRILIDQFLELRRKRFQSELEPMRMS